MFNERNQPNPSAKGHYFPSLIKRESKQINTTISY
jgi:hypothetical protein